MYLWRKPYFTLIPILTITLSLTEAFYFCKSINVDLLKDCECIENVDNIRLKCRFNNTQSFDVDIKGNEYRINCLGSIVPKINFNVASPTKDCCDAAKYFNFRRCRIQNDLILSTRMIKLINTNKTQKLVVEENDIRNICRQNFIGFEKVEIFNLEDSVDFSYLPKDLLYDMISLKSINIMNNLFTSIPEDLFRNSVNLEKLEISRNTLPSLPVNLFANLTKLKSLVLWGNKLESLESALFKNLNKLQVLELQTNFLSNLTVDVFENLPNLRNLSMRNNKFTTFPENLFKSNRKLSLLLLDNNVFLETLPNGFLANLTYLQVVSMNYTSLSWIPHDIFWGSENLRVLHLKDNKLRVIQRRLFKDAFKLEILSFENNQLEIIEAGAFEKLSNLKILHLEKNKLVSLQFGTFNGLRSLQQLYMQHNNLTELPQNTFRVNRNLERIDLSYNQLTLEDKLFSIGTQKHSIFSFNEKLKYLNLEHNDIKNIFTDWTWNMAQLETLLLSHNKISYIEFGNINFIHSNKVIVDLENNEITTVDLSNAEYYIDPTMDQKDYEKSYTTVKLGGNPIKCDCRIYDFIRYFDGSINPIIRSMVNIVDDNLICKSPAGYEGIDITKLNSQSLVCSLDDGPKTPNGCNTPYYNYRQSDNRIILDCANNNLRKIPQINLNKFNSTTMFAMNMDKIDIEVNLQGNKITEMPAPNMGYENVIVMDLSHNLINEVQWIPPKIKILKLNDNNLTYLNCDELLLINHTSILNVTFHNNPWRCDCDLLNFTKYLQDNFIKIPYLHNVTCAGSVYKEVTSLTRNELCPVSMAVIISLSVILSFFGFAIGLLAALYYRYNQPIKVWLFAHNMCLYLITEEELDQSKTYDAFISFSHQDEDFVVEKLLPGLEQGPNPFKICIHFRNWQPGEFITTNIARSIDESKRTVVVLSKNFLKSEWGKMEFRTAHTEAMKEGRARVIVIVYDDIGPIDELDAELKAYLQTNTYLKWDSPWFWDNLRYAMPHPPKFAKPQPITAVPNHKLDIEKTPSTEFEDRIDLIHEPVTPPAATTPPANSINRLEDALLDKLSPCSALNVALIDGSLVNALDKSTRNHNNNSALVYNV